MSTRPPPLIGVPLWRIAARVLTIASLSALYGLIIGLTAGTMIPLFGTIVGAAIGAANGLICGLALARVTYRRNPAPFRKALAWSCAVAGGGCLIGFTGLLMPTNTKSPISPGLAAWWPVLTFAACTITCCTITARRARKLPPSWPDFGPGHCQACNYDLTGTPNADTCPECGTARDPAPAPA